MYNTFVSTYQGLEEVLEEELQELGYSDRIVRKVRRGVYLEKLDLEDIYRLNYELRTALRVLINLRSFRIFRADQLAHKLRHEKWERWFLPEHSFKVEAVVNRSELFRNSQYAAQVAKDGIVDHFMDKFGKRPEVELRYPQIRIHLLISSDQVTISLDSSGESLHKRGSKVSNGIAPLSEVLASGILKLSGWTPDTPLFDPMCGSGTFLTEAYGIATKTPAGKYRREFAFQNWNNFNSDTWQSVKDESNAKTLPHSESLQIRGADRSPDAMRSSRRNLDQIGAGRVQISKEDFFRSFPKESEGMLIMNPPYDKRIQLDGEDSFYPRIGDQFKKAYPGWRAGVFSSNMPQLKRTGLKPQKRIPLFNGPLEGRLFLFELYSGSRKVKGNPEENQD
ncbi:class I SAM-dependent RNA methyltransferase [bacterium SCSIO 12741]|nr:class I SAM-dependent RNA methyltransferase [bacterium SCSIO 12741]